jgi:hypothetical protein
MKRVQDAIAARQREFAALPFSKRLEVEGTIEDVAAFAPGLTFFVLAFQDVLRLNESRVADPDIRRIVRKHRFEERGHEAWFLHDIAELRIERDIRWVFGPHHEATRDASYAIIGEVLAARDDRVRLTLLLILEATSEIFASRIAKYLGQTGHKNPLYYFARTHHDREMSHEMFGGEAKREILSIELAPDVLKDALGLVERVFDAMTEVFAELEARVARARMGQASLPPRSPQPT